jgi:hypothetical protein
LSGGGRGQGGGGGKPSHGGGNPNFNGFERIDLGGLTTATSKTIGNGWRHLILRGVIRSTRAAQTLSALGIRYNGDAGTNYQYQHVYGVATGTTKAIVQAATIGPYIECPAANSGAGFSANFRVDIPFYGETSFHKAGHMEAQVHRDTTNILHHAWTQGFHWASAAAIAGITFIETTANPFAAGSYVDIIGVD